LSLRYEWFYLLCGVITGVEVRADHCLDDLGVIGHLCHDPSLHVFHSRGVHGSVDLGLLALRYTSKTNGISAHACCHTLLEAAVLAAVAIDTEYGALLVLRAWPVVNSLLNRPAEEALASLAGVNPVVEPRGLVTADTAQNTVVSIKLYSFLLLLVTRR